MPNSDFQERKPDDVGDVVNFARDAAIECIHAVQCLQAAFQQSGGQHAADYYEQLARLYASLRMGWEPICRCWPELATLAGPPESVIKPELASSPTIAWIRAEVVFFDAIDRLGHTPSATLAWTEWSDIYWPDDELDHEILPTNVHRWNLDGADFLKSWRPEALTKILEGIRHEAPALDRTSDTLVSPPQPRRFPPEVLPQRRHELERLLISTDEVIRSFQSRSSRLYEVIRPVHSDGASVVQDGVIDINKLKEAFAAFEEHMHSFFPDVSRYLDRYDVARLGREMIYARRNWQEVGTRAAVLSIVALGSKWQELLSQLRSHVEVELEKLDQPTSDVEPESEHLIESITFEFGDNNWKVKARRRGKAKTRKEDTFSIESDHTKIVWCFAGKIAAGNPSEIVDWRDLNRAVSETEESVPETSDTASDKLRKLLASLRDKFLKCLGPPPSKSNAWIETVKLQGICLNRGVEWNLGKKACQILNPKSKGASPTHPQKMAPTTARMAKVRECVIARHS